jgi:DNA-binding transcriptional ArsR family regulator
MIMNVSELQSQAQQVTTLLKAMGNERRFLILCYLVDGERSVGELERLVGLSQSALSQHLARLRRDGLVRTRRSAQTIYYSLQGDLPLGVMQALHQVFCGKQGAHVLATELQRELDGAIEDENPSPGPDVPDGASRGMDSRA